MSGILFSKIVFGPVQSRRFGMSLGINLLPANCKHCSFDCVYCECGNTCNGYPNGKLPGRDQVRNALYQSFEDMAADGQDPDVITFAGNGEPTLHPEFEEIIDDALEVRDTFFRDTDIVVLSNATTLDKPGIKKALGKADKCVLKLDSAINNTYGALNGKKDMFDVNKVISNIAELDFRVSIQTMFTKGNCEGKRIDNTTDTEVEAWTMALKEINPVEVQIYTISRDVPDNSNFEIIPETFLRSLTQKTTKEGFNCLLAL